MLDLTACNVERTGEGDYLVRWRGFHPGQKVSIYMSDDPEPFYAGADPGTPVAQSRGEEALVRNPDKTVRHYFYLESENGEGSVLAERRLSLQGAPNFRDLGGYEAGDGRRLKWGRLYRSSKLSSLSETDIDYVRRLGLTLVCDFRQAIEQELDPTVLGEHPTHVTARLPVMPGSAQSFMDSLHDGIIEVHDATAFMENINRELVATQMPRYAEMFQLLLAEDQQLLIHCASGKDRTGVGAALILDVLGVPEEAIIEDYLLTNECLPVDEELERLSRLTDRSGRAVDQAALRPMLEVRPEYIQACFDEIRQRYRSREHFFETALELDDDKVARLRERYLQ
ncbi:MAG: tyrosine-protein phosphatase [Halioglobus sp.]|nr:tyrosine-protein phosphatase [Halioglobus sp.]